MKQLLIISLFSLLMIGCATQQQCPTINCPQPTLVSAPQPEPTTEIVQEGKKIYKFNWGTEAYLILEDKKMDIINCGKTAYGPLAVETIKETLTSNNLQLRNLIISNTESSYIGGCKDIVVAFPEIEYVYIFGQSQDTKEYNDFIIWTPPGKLIGLNQTYEMPQGILVDKSV